MLRITPRGVKSFSVQYRVAGEGGVTATGRQRQGIYHRITLGTTALVGLAQAREQARLIMQAATSGHDPREERRAKHLIRHSNTFKLAAARFIETELKPTIKRWKNAEVTFRLHVEPEWENTPIQDIRRADVHELLDDLVADDRVALAREVRKHLSRFFSWAVNRELIQASPMVGLERGDLIIKKEAGRALTDDELRAVWAGSVEMAYPFGPLYQLLMLTGQRRGEWAAASRSEINCARNLLEVPKARYKGGRDHVVPLVNQAWAIFESLPVWPGNDYYIFSTMGGTRPVAGFSKAKAALNRASDVANWRVHDLRVTCETRLASLGFNQEVRDAVLGHAKPGLQKTYNKHDYFDQKRAALTAYQHHLQEIGVVR
jgi:site-specific recombinase XerD